MSSFFQAKQPERFVAELISHPSVEGMAEVLKASCDLE
jgi:hypothetical protein